MATAGYSGKPLPDKLGVKPGGTLYLMHVPAEVRAALVPLPAGARLAAAARGRVMLLLCCVTSRAALVAAVPSLLERVAADGAVWISWPKKASPQFVDLTEDGIREVLLPTGLVDVKVCAVTDHWSGLKMMVRKERRADWEREGQ